MANKDLVYREDVLALQYFVGEHATWAVPYEDGESVVSVTDIESIPAVDLADITLRDGTNDGTCCPFCGAKLGDK